jgi:hypothetical protein
LEHIAIQRKQSHCEYVVRLKVWILWEEGLNDLVLHLNQLDHISDVSHNGDHHEAHIDIAAASSLNVLSSDE